MPLQGVLVGNLHSTIPVSFEGWMNLKPSPLLVPWRKYSAYGFFENLSQQVKQA